ncbi:MAG: 6-phosphofructokinase [SAR202 cluster bacterium Io17-Chloro-G9]|nr:MAG: 6-phosphofructokinase [SAR202 cluster bacterium Io17-Chloro-G9]
MGILVSGGPAPGINSAISAATIEATNCGLQVLGIYDGFEHLVDGRTDMVRSLTIPDVSRIHFQGGSILRTSRTPITKRAQDLDNTLNTLLGVGIKYLVLIGGDGTAQAGGALAGVAGGRIRIAQIPKTIDNDLPLPGGMPTFGYETARHTGTHLVLNLMEDSRTTNRWYFVVVMGRTAGHLALGIGKAAGATLTVIPEEFPEGGVSFDTVCTVLEGAMLKRRTLGRKDGLAVIAEGVASRLDPGDLAKVAGSEVNYGSQGLIRPGEVPLATALRRQVQRRFLARGEEISMVDATLGYDLRSASPIPFDIDYTRTLGYGAVRFLLSDSPNDPHKQHGLVCLENGRLAVVPFEDLRDGETGDIRLRRVDIQSEYYKVARQYMIRQEPIDSGEPGIDTDLAESGNVPTGEFHTLFDSTPPATPPAR